MAKSAKVRAIRRRYSILQLKAAFPSEGLGQQQHQPALTDYCAGLKKFLKKNVDGETMAVADSKLGSIVKEKLGIPCIYKCAVLVCVGSVIVHVSSITEAMSCAATLYWSSTEAFAHS